MQFLSQNKLTLKEAEGYEEWALNKKSLSEEETQSLIDEVVRFAGLNSLSDQANFKISDNCLITVFKLIAYIVDSR